MYLKDLQYEDAFILYMKYNMLVFFYVISSCMYVGSRLYFVLFGADYSSIEFDIIQDIKLFPEKTKRSLSIALKK